MCQSWHENRYKEERMAQDKAVKALLLNVHPTRRALLKRILVGAGALVFALPVSSAEAGV
jgi:hypothetical protein